MIHIRAHDVLYVMLEELCTEGRKFEMWDADRRTAWFAKCRQLLAEVPDVYQRLAWAYVLAQAFTIGLPGVNFDLVLGWLRKDDEPKGGPHETE